MNDFSAIVRYVEKLSEKLSASLKNNIHFLTLTTWKQSLY